MEYGIPALGRENVFGVGGHNLLYFIPILYIKVQDHEPHSQHQYNEDIERQFLDA